MVRFAAEAGVVASGRVAFPGVRRDVEDVRVHVAKGGTGRVQGGRAWAKLRGLRVREPAAAYGSWRTAPVPEASPTVDPDDELFLLGERCAETYMRAEAMQYEAMVLLAEFDEREGWRGTAFGSTAEWLAWRIGIKPGAARERVRTARALTELPQTSRAMRAGEISFTKVRALTRVARPESEDALLELARACSAARLERKLRVWTTDSVSAERNSEARRHASRTFSVFPEDDGMYVVRGRLDPEVGAALMRAVEAAGDVLYLRRRRGAAEAEPAPVDAEVDADVDATPEQRRADAIGLVAERALAAGFAGGPVSGARAERYQVVLHVEPATLRESSGGVSAETSEATAASHARPLSALEDGVRISAETSEATAAFDPRPLSALEDGVRVSAETSRRLACDASTVRITRAGGADQRPHVGAFARVLDVGRRTRTVPPALRRALDARDGGCRFPGCGSRFSEAHHIEHWADGGATRLENLVLLCRRHHRAVHEGRATVCRGADDSVAFFAQDGAVLYDAPPRRVDAGADPGHERLRAVAADEVRTNLPAHRLGASRWMHDREMPLGIEIRALEAVERAAGW